MKPNTLDTILDELLDESKTTVFSQRERMLAREARRLKEENHKLQAEHDFALSSWQEAVKRSGKLSADLEASKVSRAHTIAAEWQEKHQAPTVANAGALIEPKTRVHRHSGGAIVILTGGAP